MFVIRRILLYVFPAVLFFISNDKFKVQLSQVENTDKILKLSLFGVACIISYALVPYFTEKDKIKVRDLSNSVKSLLGSLRKEVSMELEKSFLTEQMKQTGVNDLKLSIRVFLQKRRSFMDLVKRRRYFKLKPYDGLHVRPVDDLAFQVNPANEAQGLVGQVYTEKNVKFDFDLQKNHSLPFYSLDANQIDKTSYCNSVVAAPIFKGNTQKVIAVITFDTEVKLKPRDKKWEDVIRTYCKIIHKIHKSIKA